MFVQKLIAITSKENFLCSGNYFEVFNTITDCFTHTAVATGGDDLIADPTQRVSVVFEQEKLVDSVVNQHKKVSRWGAKTFAKCTPFSAFTL